jgi:hypothetical protein
MNSLDLLLLSRQKNIMECCFPRQCKGNSYLPALTGHGIFGPVSLDAVKVCHSAEYSA